MDRFEMTEKLREKTGVSYEEAKAALETTEWDLLEAIILLEGKAAKKPDPQAGAAQDTASRQAEAHEESAPEKEARRTYRRVEYRREGARREHPKADTAAMRRAAQRVIDFISLLIDRGSRNRLEAYTADRTLVSVPLTVLALALILLFWLTVPAMVCGLIFGVRYRLVGRDVGGLFKNSERDAK